jgi:hypothetical protein
MSTCYVRVLCSFIIMEHHLENIYSGALLPELVDPRHQKRQPIIIVV